MIGDGGIIDLRTRIAALESAGPGGGGSGTVTSVTGTGTVNGITLSGTVTTSGNLTLSGAVTVDWADITSKPTTFAPSAHTHIIADVTGLQAALDGKQPLATVLTNTTAAFTTAQETKLAGIATGATANSADATLLARANHTGTQAAGTITGLATVATSGSAADLTGNLAVSRLNDGTGATALTFWRGDGTWAVPAGGGLGTVTSVDVSGGTTGLTFTGGPVTATGTLTAGGTLGVANGGTGGGNAAAARSSLGAAASGAVTASGLTMATARILGRSTAASGAIEEITVGSGLSMSGGTLSATGGGSDPWTYIKLASDFVTSSATAVDITGLAFAPIASTQYEFEAVLLLRTATAATGPRPGLAWPTGGTDGVGMIDTPTSATARALTNGNINAALLGPVGGLPNTTQSYPAKIKGTFIAGLTPVGTVKLQLASETGGTNVTAKAGSFLKYRTI